MNPESTSLEINGALAGKRLDLVLEFLTPGSSLRARRRLISRGCVLVDGKQGRAGQKLSLGQQVKLLMPSKSLPQWSVAERPRLLASHNGYHFFYKPSGLHTESIAASIAPSLSDYCADLAGCPVQLLQRLDFNTCGIVCGADNRQSASAFRQTEKVGGTAKFYLTVLCGKLEKELTVKNGLDCSNRRKSLALAKDAEPARWTVLRPLRTFAAAEGINCDGADRTLALCAINRGQRHQIRAHAASIGHPLAGDGLYGGGPGKYFLAHICLAFAEEYCLYLPPALDVVLGQLTEDRQQVLNDLRVSLPENNNRSRI